MFDRDQLDALLDLGVAGCAELAEAQRKALAGAREALAGAPREAWTVTLLLATRTPRSWSSCGGSWTARSAPGDRAGGPRRRPGYPEVPETGLTFGENALIKAREGCRRTGLPTVADDSGLAVDALNGMPGCSAPAGPAGTATTGPTCELVLAQIADVADEHRGAAFVCAAALVLPGGREHLVDGRQAGRLLRAPRGATAGSATTRSSSATDRTGPTPS